MARHRSETTVTGDAEVQGVTYSALVGDVTGNVTGNVTGDVAGNLTGEVNAAKLDTSATGVGFYGASPSAQPAAVANASGGVVVDAEARAALNALLARLRTLGLIAT